MNRDPQGDLDAERVVREFFDLAFVQREAAEAAERYLGVRYTQHNPTAPDGAEIFPQLIGDLFSPAPQASFHLNLHHRRREVGR